MIITDNEQLDNDYFDWLYDYVCRGRTNAMLSYKKLLKYLYRTEFTYLIPFDENRAMDGISLRYRFSTYIGEPRILDMFNEYAPCSVLEMMVALSVRCEETIMDDTRYGNRTGQWFYDMLSNLSLITMNDDNFDEEYVKNRIDILLNRLYDPDGRGGLFYIRNSYHDLRRVEIWDQMCWYLNRFI